MFTISSSFPNGCLELLNEEDICWVSQKGQRIVNGLPLVVVVVETDSADLVLAIADWAESVSTMEVQVLVCGARHTQTQSTPFSGCWLATLVRLGQQEVKRRLGKVVVVWDRTAWPHNEALESLALAGREVMVEVVVVRSRCHLNHPALIIGLEESGGELRLVDS